MFEVGQRIQCIRDIWDCPRELMPEMAKSGEIYTIREIEPGDPGCGVKEYLYLHEIAPRKWRIKGKFYDDVGFPGQNFRPLTESKTDISIFKEIDESVFGKTPERV